MPECVVHLNTEHTWRGGEQQILYLAQGLAAAGLRTVVVGQPGGALNDRCAQAGADFVPLRMRGEGDLAAAYRLGRLLARLRCDILHMHTTHAHSLGVLAARLFASGRPIRCVVSKRTDFSIFRHAFLGPLGRSLGLNRIKYRHGVDRYIAISQCIKDVLVADGLDPEVIDVVHSGVDPERWRGGDQRRLRAELGLAPEVPVVLNIAHLADHKGQRYLVEAAPAILARQPRSRIIIVGDGELRTELEERVRALGLEGRVILTGFRQDIADFWDLAAVFVLSSHREGLGTVVLDAFATGTPVVAAAAGGAPEMVTDGQTGLLVPVRDPAALAAAVCRLLEDRNLAQACVAGAERLLRERFTVEAMVAGNLAVYEAALEAAV